MKRIINRFAFIALTGLLLLSFNANAQLLLNEVEIDPPVDVGDRCQYVEIKGSPGGTVPANTYFVSINSDQDNFGFVNVAVNVSAITYGANGTITLINTLQGNCPNRNFDPGTTILNYSSLASLGQGSEGFYIINSGGASLFSGQDLDTNDDGNIDNPLVGGITFIDGFNLIFNPDEQFAYGNGPNLVETLLGDVPDAATRFRGNDTPNSAAAWYSGELAASPEETNAYAAPFSSNFPGGGMLTPGGENVPDQPGNRARFDFDGDGKTDISVFRPAPGEWWYMKSSDGNTNAFQFGQSSDTIVPADFTGDGKTDIAIWRESGGQWFVLRSEDNSFFAFPFGTAGDIPIPGDFDGDGKADAAVFRPSNATWFISNSGGGTTIEQFGLSGDVPVVEDYDGDGMDDIAVFRPSVAEWYLKRSTAGFIGFQFGIPGDTRTVPADYTGDGKADVAFFRPSSSEWFVLRSEDSSFFAFPFGSGGDIPAPGDYDGDGQADAAVFRPSSNIWFLNQSTNGSLAVQFGIANDIPIPSAYIP